MNGVRGDERSKGRWKEMKGDGRRWIRPACAAFRWAELERLEQTADCRLVLKLRGSLCFSRTAHADRYRSKKQGWKTLENARKSERTRRPSVRLHLASAGLANLVVCLELGLGFFWGFMVIRRLTGNFRQDNNKNKLKINNQIKLKINKKSQTKQSYFVRSRFSCHCIVNHPFQTAFRPFWPLLHNPFWRLNVNIWNIRLKWQKSPYISRNFFLAQIICIDKLKWTFWIDRTLQIFSSVTVAFCTSIVLNSWWLWFRKKNSTPSSSNPMVRILEMTVEKRYWNFKNYFLFKMWFWERCRCLNYPNPFIRCCGSLMKCRCYSTLRRSNKRPGETSSDILKSRVCS